MTARCHNFDVDHVDTELRLLEGFERIEVPSKTTHALLVVQFGYVNIIGNDLEENLSKLR